MTTASENAPDADLFMILMNGWEILNNQIKCTYHLERMFIQVEKSLVKCPLVKYYVYMCPEIIHLMSAIIVQG